MNFFAPLPCLVSMDTTTAQEPPCESWEWKTGPLQEQVLFTTELSLKPKTSALFKAFSMLMCSQS